MSCKKGPLVEVMHTVMNYYINIAENKYVLAPEYVDLINGIAVEVRDYMQSKVPGVPVLESFLLEKICQASKLPIDFGQLPKEIENLITMNKLLLNPTLFYIEREKE